MASIQLVTGPVARPGVLSDLGGSATGAQLSADLHARYAMAAVRNAIFHASTPVTGVAPGTALSATPPIAIWNPPNSGRILSLVRSRMAYISGTLGAGAIVYAMAPQNTAPTGGTELQPTSSMLMSGGGVARVFSGSTLAATPTIIAPAMTMAATLATVTATMIQPFGVAQDEIAGEIETPPGFVVCMQAIATAGTTPLVLFGLSFEEIAAVIAL